MTNGEVWKLCLDDRTAKLEELKKELEQLEIDYKKAEFEEDMYARLKENAGSQYRPTFTEKHDKSMKNVDGLEEKKENLQNDIKIIEKEIDYINNLMECMRKSL